MSIIESIKQNILTLEQGAFQNMCNAFLSKEGYGVIMSLGSQAGTQKTAPGTPDTYFVTKDGRYVFVEYTTQQPGIARKIKDDLNKCFDVAKTKVPLDKIAEIVYCHTSSNLKPGDDLALRNQCADNGIELTLYGIDELAKRLYLLHRDIAQEYLGISMGTGQIKGIQQFIKDYDKNTLAAPLNTQFLYREKEIEQLERAFEATNVVILSGRAGVGKSRLALHFSEVHAKENQETLYCIRSNAQPLYEDLIQHLKMPGNYFLFVDDANELSSGLQHILEYATGKDSQYNVRVLITVRDYAADAVYRIAKPLVQYKAMDIPVFSDEQIKTLIQKTYDITNPDYLDRIVRIAEGNARIAMLAGSTAKRENSLESINDLTALFECYYGSALTEKKLNSDRQLMITAGIVALLSPFDCRKIDPIIPLLHKCSLSQNSFIEKLYELHEKEIVEIHYNQIVRFDEQCLGNYILKHVFVDKKYLSLSEMIRCCFEPYHEKTIRAINTICGVFPTSTVFNYVEQQIASLWNDLEEENYPHFHEFVKAFHCANPIAALLYIQNYIETCEESKELPSYEEIQKGKNHQNVSDDFINMLGSFADTPYLNDALDLFFKYYSKCCGKFMQFYHAVQTYYNITPKSYRNNYYTQNLFVKKLKDFSNNWKDTSFRQFLIELAPKLLMFEHTATEGSRGKHFTLYRMEITAHDNALEYRSELWEALKHIALTGDFSCIEKTLEEYGNGYSNNSKEVIIAEAFTLHSLVNTVLEPDNLQHCLIVEHLARIWSDCGCMPTDDLQSFLASPVMQYYRVLKGPGYKTPYEQREDIQKKTVAQYITEHGLTGIKKLIDTCCQYAKTRRNTWDIANGLRFAFNSIACSDIIVPAIEYYIYCDTPLCLQPLPFIEQLFSKCDILKVHQIVFDSNYEQKNLWEFSYFVAYPTEKIGQETIEELYSFMYATDDANITTSPCRDILLFRKYEAVDPDVLINIGEIVLKKFEYSPFMASMYCNLLFNEHFYAPEVVIQAFAGHFNLLEKLYVLTVSRKTHLGDYRGVFARTFMRSHPSFVNTYAKYIAELTMQHQIDHAREQLIAIFEEEDAFYILDCIVDTVISQCEHAYFTLPNLFKELLLPEQGRKGVKQKQSDWIRHLITHYADDALRMQSLFETIAKFSEDRKIEYIMFYLEHNPSYEAFKKLPLMPRLLSWSNSAVPMYSQYKAFMVALSNQMSGVRYLKHRQHVLNKITDLQTTIEREQMRDILEN